KLLREIIMADYHETFWKEEEKIMPIHVGVHFVKLLVTQDGEKAVSSPDCLHQDGEPFTFAHLIKRENVKGGTNAIGIPAVRGSRRSWQTWMNSAAVFPRKFFPSGRGRSPCADYRQKRPGRTDLLPDWRGHCH